MTLANHMAVRKTLIVLAVASITQVQAAPPVTNYEYDANGNNTKVTNGLSHAATQEYDAIDRLKKQSQPHPTSTGQLGQINQIYDATDNLTAVVDPRNLETGYTKNAFGDVLSLISPDTATTNYTYDNTGNVLTKTDARGAVATYTYDAINRLKTITYKPSATGAVGESVAFGYDAGTNGKGKLTSMSDASGATSWSYNTQGNLIKKRQLTVARGFEVQWEYDAAGRVSRKIYPSSRYIDYGYNTNGKVNQISVDGQIMISSITYHPNGLVKSYTWGNSKSYTQSVDNSGRPVAVTLGGELLKIIYDDAGRITQTYRSLPTSPNTPITGSLSTNSYDNLARLVSQVNSTTNTGYQYDLNGNRTNLAIGSNNYSYAIASSSNKLLSTAGPTASSYNYDAAGNVTGDGQNTYIYASSGRLGQVKQTSTGTVKYQPLYNGLGQVVYRSVDYPHYVYDENQRIIGEYNTDGDAIQETVYLGNIPILTLRPDSLMRVADNSYNISGSTSAAVTGSWASANAIKGFYGDNYLTHTVAASTTDKVTYTFTPTATQSFKVYARWIAQAGNATNATYTITPNTSGSTPTSINVDQTQNGGTWNYLGTYSLNTANQMTVALSGQGNGVVIADSIRFVPANASNIQNNTFFVHTDHLNTPRLVANYNNVTRWTWHHETSEAFGANTPNENPSGAGAFTYNFRFPGQLYNSATQLSYNYYRDYNPRTGRYIESDPIGLDAGQMSTYAYVDGNPISYFDPLGLLKINLFNPNDRPAYLGANADPDVDGTCTVYAHGNDGYVSDQRNGTDPKTKVSLYPKELNKMLNESGCRDKPVILKSCNTGKGNNSVAEQLAKLPGRSGVSAPNRQLWFSGGVFNTGIGAGVDPIPYGTVYKSNPAVKNLNDPGVYNYFK